MNHSNEPVTVFISKVHPTATLPTKRVEDAGYDLYACLPSTIEDGKETISLYCPVHTSTLVPTGIALVLPSTHYFNTKHERGSTGKLSMSILSGVVDSGYRGEIFVNVTPLHKDIWITNQVKEVKETENAIYYPYGKAIAQGTIELVPIVEWKEIPYEELQRLPSERGMTKLGESGK